MRSTIAQTVMKFPSLFVNHGGGPMPLLGQQEGLANNMREVVSDFLPKEDPKAIVVLSAHWESNPISISSSAHPQMYFDYGGFPPESYEYEYPAPGDPELAQKIQSLLGENGLESRLDPNRGYDHGVFVPLMLMYPEAKIPVVCVSLHPSLDAEINMRIGASLEPLREEGILILGSGLSFHNMQAFFSPTTRTKQASHSFNDWLKDALLSGKGPTEYLDKLKNWTLAPGARICHPREEHLLPLFMVAAAGGKSAKPRLVYDTSMCEDETAEHFTEHAVAGYLFE